jgi:hypothetical protein
MTSFDKKKVFLNIFQIFKISKKERKKERKKENNTINTRAAHAVYVDGFSVLFCFQSLNMICLRFFLSN